MTRRRNAALLAGAAVGSLLLSAFVAPSAYATSNPVQGDFLCLTTVQVSGTSSTLVPEPQQLRTTVDVPAMNDGTAVATATFTAPASSTMPLSPPVELTNVSVTTSARIEVYTSAKNDPTAAGGLSAPTIALGTSASPTAYPTQAAETPWEFSTAVGVVLPSADAGLRQWIRPIEVSYVWTADGAQGQTSCRLVDVPAVVPGGTVEHPAYGLSYQYPDAAPITSEGKTSAEVTALFGGAGARTTVSGTATPDPVDECEVPEGGSCDTEQEVEVEVTPGNLMQSATAAAGNPSATQVVLTDEVTGNPYITVDAVSQTMVGPMNPVTVTDLRGSADGWSLTAALSDDFTAVTGGAITKDHVALTGVGCAPVTGSATRVAGVGGNLSSPAVTLCKVEPGVDDSSGDSGSGQYVVSAQVELEVPAFQRAGEYTSTLTITLT